MPGQQVPAMEKPAVDMSSFFFFTSTACYSMVIKYTIYKSISYRFLNFLLDYVSNFQNFRKGIFLRLAV